MPKGANGPGQRLPFRCNETKTRRAAGRRSPWSPIRCHHTELRDILKSGSALEEREREATKLTQTVHRTGSRTPLARLFFPCTVHRQPLRQSTTPHTGVGYYTTTMARTSINLVSLVLFIVSILDHARRLGVDRWGRDLRVHPSVRTLRVSSEPEI